MVFSVLGTVWGDTELKRCPWEERLPSEQMDGHADRASTGPDTQEDLQRTCQVSELYVLRGEEKQSEGQCQVPWERLGGTLIE